MYVDDFGDIRVSVTRRWVVFTMAAVRVRDERRKGMKRAGAFDVLRSRDEDDDGRRKPRMTI